jgi:hypothetical protein
MRLTEFSTYQGAFTIRRKTFDWKRSNVESLQVGRVSNETGSEFWWPWTPEWLLWQGLEAIVWFGFVTGFIRFTYNSTNLQSLTIHYNKSSTIITYSITCKALNLRPSLSLVTSTCTAITTLRSLSSTSFLVLGLVTDWLALGPVTNWLTGWLLASSQSQSQSQSYITSTASQPICLGVRHPFGTRDQFFFFFL